MKKILNNLAVIFLLLIQVTACQKKPVIVPPVKEEVCQITQMTFPWDSRYRNSDSVTATFKYNSLGNPVSVIVTHVATGNPHALFLYDQYNRLTDFISTYEGNTDPANMPASFAFEYWVQYVYADQNPLSMPVSDTFRQVGFYKGGKIDYSAYMRIESIAYDSQGRIIRGNGYDANGNLILPNVKYDNKKNYRQTNKIWMLVDKNYSKNNPFIATTYSSEGYPTTFPEPVPPLVHLDNFLIKERDFLTMDYSCSLVQTAQ